MHLDKAGSHEILQDLLSVYVAPNPRPNAKPCPVQETSSLQAQDYQRFLTQMPSGHGKKCTFFWVEFKGIGTLPPKKKGVEAGRATSTGQHRSLRWPFHTAAKHRGAPLAFEVLVPEASGHRQARDLAQEASGPVAGEGWGCGRRAGGGWEGGGASREFGRAPSSFGAGKPTNSQQTYRVNRADQELADLANMARCIVWWPWLESTSMNGSTTSLPWF